MPKIDIKIESPEWQISMLPKLHEHTRIHTYVRVNSSDKNNWTFEEILLGYVMAHCCKIVLGTVLLGPRWKIVGAVDFNTLFVFKCPVNVLRVFICPCRFIQSHYCGKSFFKSWYPFWLEQKTCLIYWLALCCYRPFIVLVSKFSNIF